MFASGVITIVGMLVMRSRATTCRGLASVLARVAPSVQVVTGARDIARAIK